ncbi:MAG: DUF3883 domain-containing protein [Candidatus Hydrogenedentes bacterium]|nr:DUF3883 domain-containing protein [Candidatus Hydrogenedentota bacterium]
MERVVFARIGWMRLYQGSQPGDERPIGGGGYNVTNIGHEICNFLAREGKCYGFFEPTGTHGAKEKTIRLERISPSEIGESLSGVCIVFVSRRPRSNGHVVIGWYRNATVFRRKQPAAIRGLDSYGYYCEALVSDAVLLPTQHRVWDIANDDRSFGQSNICYQLDSKGNDKGLSWQKSVIRKVLAYEGENSAQNPTAEVAEFASALSGGQGFGLDSTSRQRVENHAMKLAQSHYRSQGYSIEDTHKTKPYDLVCRRGGEARYVEVKGTTGGGDSVFLTTGEVLHAQQNPYNCELFVVHSIRVEQCRNDVKANGGETTILSPWRPNKECLTPLLFKYKLK